MPSHTASSDGAEFDSGTLGSGGGFSHTFSTKGTFTYPCAFHANMTGTITVQ
ncbi:MAG TPA: plastocyanin/azurin family copper-binding protein [Longimicrobiales bacterium]